MIQKDEIIQDMIWFAQPIFEAVQDQNQLILFFREFGYDLQPADVSSIYTGLQAISTTIATAIGNANSSSDTEIDPKLLIDIFKAIVSLETIVPSGTYFGTELFTEIFDYLLYRYLSVKRNIACAIAVAAGVIEYTAIPAGARDVAYSRIKFNWARFPQLINDTKTWAKEVYGWGGSTVSGDAKSLDYERLFSALALLLESAGLSLVLVKKQSAAELTGFISNNTSAKSFYSASLPFLQNSVSSIDTSGTPAFANEAGFKLMPYGDLNQQQLLGVALMPYVKGTATGEQELAENTVLTTTVSAEVAGGYYITITPAGIASHTGADINGEFEFEIKYSDLATNNPIQLLTVAETSSVETGAVKVAFGGNLNGDFYLSAGLEKLKATIDLSGDALLKNFIPEPVIITVGDLLVKWQFNKGIYFEGGNNISIDVPLHIEAGPINLTGIAIEIELAPEPTLELGIQGGFNLGPIQASVDGVGFKAKLIAAENGLFGKYDLSLALKPPDGIGLSINAGIVTGGGYLYIDADKGEYAGALQLSVNNFLSLTAIGLISTKMPDGSDGFSMLVIVTAQFMPPFQLGYGFTLNGVGGLLGLNREVLLDPLRDGVRTGAINGIMFPTDVIANAPRIISDLQTIFPTKEGYFLVGPMAMIGWGTPTLISLSLGVIIQLPDPAIAILGVLKIVLPTEEIDVLRLQVNFLGTIDPSNQLITFDASLYDSNLLKLFTLTGDMAVRLKWGDKPDFILSAGGFHPEYEPTMTMPVLKRIGIKILDLENARIQVQTYFALTSNTVQFGARADCYFGLDGFSVSGLIGFDALMQFSPFTFKANAYGAFVLDTPLGDASINIDALLKGPAPWQVKATGSIKVFGVEFEAEFEKKWGKSKQEELPSIALKPLLLDEFKKDDVWSGILPSGFTQLVSVSSPSTTTSAAILIFPNSEIVVSQNLVPLKMELEKIGNQEISDITTATLSGLKIGSLSLSITDITDAFAIGQYINLSDAEKLSKPSFEALNAGIKATYVSGGFDYIMGSTTKTEQTYEQVIVDLEKPRLTGSFKTKKFTDLLKGSAAAKSKLSKRYKTELGIAALKTKEVPSLFEVVNVTDSGNVAPAKLFNSHIEATQYLESLCVQQAALKPNLTVIEKY